MSALRGQGELKQLIELNRTCACLPVDRMAVDAAIAEQSTHEGFSDLLADRENLFAGSVVFVSQADVNAMQTQIAEIEATTDLPGFRVAALGRSTSSALSVQQGTRGGMVGYDFHLTPDGPRLIEVNTNAGGAFLMNALEAAIGAPSWTPNVETNLVGMFESEWRLAGRSGRPKTLVILDDAPEAQYLYPDMVLAKELLGNHGIDTSIANPAALRLQDGRLYSGNKPVDMIYNRLTDFALVAPENSVLRQALERDLVVVTPAPRHHALLADKRNLVTLTDQAALEELGLSARQRRVLADLPKTVHVSPETQEALWTQRKGLFFKPVAGYGGKAVYRGAKLTRRVWANIVDGSYVAQALVPPTLRSVVLSSGAVTLKFDLRVFSYAGAPLLLAARVYEGQTTNFRTDGGGFAAVIVVDSTETGSKWSPAMSPAQARRKLEES